VRCLSLLAASSAALLLVACGGTSGSTAASDACELLRADDVDESTDFPAPPKPNTAARVDFARKLTRCDALIGQPRATVFAVLGRKDDPRARETIRKLPDTASWFVGVDYLGDNQLLVMSFNGKGRLTEAKFYV
jgi:hypothetical protein